MSFNLTFTNGIEEEFCGVVSIKNLNKPDLNLAPTDLTVFFQEEGLNNGVFEIIYENGVKRAVIKGNHIRNINFGFPKDA